jgi:hypothetical protein
MALLRHWEGGREEGWSAARPLASWTVECEGLLFGGGPFSLRRVAALFSVVCTRGFDRDVRAPTTLMYCRLHRPTLGQTVSAAAAAPPAVEL